MELLVPREDGDGVAEDGVLALAELSLDVRVARDDVAVEREELAGVASLGEIDDRIPRSAVVRADVRTPWAAKGSVMREVAGVARQHHGSSTDHTEGIKVIQDDGSWCLVVPDRAEAVVRLWAEGATLEESRALLASWTDVVARATR